MPSGRDSFRRNRVAPFVLFYFITPRGIGFNLCLPHSSDMCRDRSDLRFCD